MNKQAAARIIQHSLVRERGKISAHSDRLQAGNGASDMTQREKELRERLLAKRKQKNNASPVPLAAAISPPAAEAAEAAEVLASISKEIDMLDAQGSEEGEIEEEPEIQQPSFNTPRLDTNAGQPSGRKRKHNEGQSSRPPIGQRADKKSRKKAKKAAKAAAAGTGTGTEG